MVLVSKKQKKNSYNQVFDAITCLKEYYFLYTCLDSLLEELQGFSALKHITSLDTEMNPL